MTEAPKTPRLLPENPRELLARNRDPRGRRLSYAVQVRNAYLDLLDDAFRRIAFERDVARLAVQTRLTPRSVLTKDNARIGGDAALELLAKIERQCRATRSAIEYEQAKAEILAKTAGPLL